MTVLSGKEIKNRLEHEDVKKRLVVAPLLEPSEQLREDQCSVDVRLGFKFALVSASSYGLIDELDEDDKTLPTLESLYRKKYIPFGQGIVIHPHQFMLASTLEYVKLPHDLMSYVVGRSTWGRLGLIVATAIGIHPLFAGTLTLELRNLGETPLKLYPGQAIGQLFFHKVKPPVNYEPKFGQYIGAVEIVPKTISSEVTLMKLKVLKTKKNK